MHRPALACLLILATLAASSPARGDAAGAIADARRQLAGRDAIAAASTLEAALATAGGEKSAVLDLLRTAYAQAAQQCEAQGKPGEAETYREDLRILNRSIKPTVPRAQSPASEPAKPPIEPLPEPAKPPIEPLPEVPPSPVPAELPPLQAPAPTPEPTSITPPKPEPEPEPAPVTKPEPEPAPAPAPATLPEPAPAPVPSALLPLPAPTPTVDLATADAAFLAERYAEAGRLYTELARARKLPKERNDCWAYCRSVAVAKRINARPTDRSEWASIDAEIQQIRKLDPENWIGEYLRNLAAERPGGKKAAASGSTVVRASSPEESPATSPPTRAAANAPAGASAKPAQTIGRWQTRESTNFRIYHVDPALAAKVAQIAETTRVRQTKFWTGAEPQAAWMPKCEIYLYPNGKIYGQMTGQPEDSPGFSTMGMNEGKLIGRRVNVRVDHPTALTAVLPHEVTHVILADFFTTQQIPRWADEGMAVLSEPADEQRRRAADLSEPLAADRLFPIANLMTMDYPESQYWNLYYAQSVSLTRFLVETGSSKLLLKYLQAAQAGDPEEELRKHYKIDGYADLQSRWVEYARKNASPALATPAPKPDLRVR
ncbi:peptidase MA family metallohydrolase [Tundrisphaera sp. TA3]|uniref:peptidase MA family metallohydrolase n=1 Tax=Tundrisphaera sp. TA3 TaxID=3435775 RepID=UPI003EB85BBF